MKIRIFLLAASLLGGIMMTHAQGFQRRTVEERVKNTMDKLGPLSLNADQTTKTDSVFTHFYKSMDSTREEMRNSGGMPDRSAMREKMMKMMGERDDQLKTIFTEDQYKKWKDEVEPSLRPQRRGGGMRGGGDRNN